MRFDRSDHQPTPQWVGTECHRLRNLVPGDPLSGMVDNLHLARRGTLAQHHDDLHRLTPFGAGDADERHLEDRWMAGDRKRVAASVIP